MLKKISLLFILLLGMNVFQSIAQNRLESIHDTINKDDLGDRTDAFQNYFFNALSYRGIENYQRAIDELNKAEDLRENEPAVFFEKGKNYASLENYTQAENYLLKTLAQQPEDMAVLGELLQVYRQSEQYSKAISTTKDLIKQEISFQKDLAQLYAVNRQFDKSLETIEVMQVSAENAFFVDSLRQEIIENKDLKGNLINSYLSDQIKKQPDNIRWYENLIFRYYQTERFSEAREVAKKLREKDSDNVWIDLVFYSEYLQENQQDQAAASMKKVLASAQIKEEIKAKVLKDFDALAKNNEAYQEDLTKVLKEDNTSDRSPKSMGEYYLGKDNLKALEYFEKALKDSPQEYRLILQVLDLQLQEKQYQKALALAEEKIDYYPTQAILYLYKGKAENALSEFAQAEKSLKNGIDFVIEDKALQAEFYIALSESFQGRGKTDKAAEYQQKADQLK